MKIALAHDYLNQFGGAERVLKVLCELFPDAPIYTLFYDRDAIGDIFAGHEIRTSFLQKVPGVKKYHRFFPLLMPLAIEQFDFSDFDISHKEQRVKFYMIIFVIGATYLFAALYFKGIFFPLSIISLGIVLGLIIFAFVSHYVKASIHVAVSSAFVATIALLYRNGSITEVGWIVPLVAWARITLKRHTFSEVFVGGVLGVAIAAITFILGKYIYSL